MCNATVAYTKSNSIISGVRQYCDQLCDNMANSSSISSSSSWFGSLQLDTNLLTLNNRYSESNFGRISSAVIGGNSQTTSHLNNYQRRLSAQLNGSEFRHSSPKSATSSRAASPAVRIYDNPVQKRWFRRGSQPFELPYTQLREQMMASLSGDQKLCLRLSGQSFQSIRKENSTGLPQGTDDSPLCAEGTLPPSTNYVQLSDPPPRRSGFGGTTVSSPPAANKIPSNATVTTTTILQLDSRQTVSGYPSNSTGQPNSVWRQNRFSQSRTTQVAAQDTGNSGVTDSSGAGVGGILPLPPTTNPNRVSGMLNGGVDKTSAVATTYVLPRDSIAYLKQQQISANTTVAAQVSNSTPTSADDDFVAMGTVFSPPQRGSRVAPTLPLQTISPPAPPLIGPLSPVATTYSPNMLPRKQSLKSTGCLPCPPRVGCLAVMEPFPDPVTGAPSTFQQRITEIMNLENETVRWERARVYGKTRKSRLVKQDSP